MWEAIIQIQKLLSQQVETERDGISAMSQSALNQYREQNLEIDALFERLQSKRIERNS
jgi:hypothetical protein